MPERIQRRRTKGWRMPEGAVYVGRPTKWGNLFPKGPVVFGFAIVDEVMEFRLLVTGEGQWPYQKEAQSELKGKDLACWCPLDQPCHADVLMEIANAAHH